MCCERTEKRYNIGMSKYESDFTQRVIEAIGKKRHDKHMTIDRLCELAGIGRNSYYAKARGERCFNTEEIDAVAKALGCDALLLLKEAAQEPTDEERIIRAALRRLQEDPPALAAYMSGNKQADMDGGAGPDYDEPA